jgi:hypothetical protein
MNDVLAGVVAMSPAFSVILGTLLAAHLLVATLLRAIPLLAIVLSPNRATRAERVLLILCGQRRGHRMGRTATEEPTTNPERY